MRTSFRIQWVILKICHFALAKPHDLALLVNSIIMLLIQPLNPVSEVFFKKLAFNFLGLLGDV